MSEARHDRTFGRRTFLTAGTVVGVGWATGVLNPRLPYGSAAAAGGARWSDPGTWGGSVPGRGDVAVITKRVVLDRDARVAGVKIKPGGTLVFAPRKSVTLESTGNVDVRGRLVMKPENRKVNHKLTFVDVDESRFVGGGMDVIDSDVGLWVMDAGVLDIQGSYRRAWSRARAGLAAGTTAFALKNDPKGWRRGDQIVVTPTGRPTQDDHFAAFDAAGISSVDGRTVRLSDRLAFAHPQVSVGRGRTMTAEVLNLTRNVTIQGTAGGRSHIFIHSTKPQTVSNALIRHMGPRVSDEELVLGRYGLHFHHCMGGSRGSVVKGVVIKECGNHSFVPHMSHGVKFRNCVAYDCIEDAFWWDDAEITNDVLWDKCVAALIRVGSAKNTNGGFVLGKGDGNVCRRCVGTGIEGISGSSSFNWTNTRSEGVWVFEDCIGHNNKANGIFVWQNTEKIHVISSFVGYHNGSAGILHGAYRNAYKYKDMILYGNGRAAILLHAQSKENSPVKFTNVLCDAAGLSEFCVNPTNHIQPPGQAVVFKGCTFKGHTKAAFGIDHPEAAHPDILEVAECSFAGNEFWLADDVNVDTIVKVDDGTGGALGLRRADQTSYGEFRPEWNARVQKIASFSGS